MRLFIAIDPSAEMVQRVAELQAKLEHTRAAVRWVRPEHFHITLKFIGEVDEGRVPEIAARMARAAGEVPPFELNVQGVGRLPERGQARVIVAQVYSPDQRITKLHRLVDSGMGGMGLDMDTRVLLPHLTLGRVSSNHGLNRLLRLMTKHEDEVLGSFMVQEVVLYRSIAGPEGSQYEALARGGMMAVAGGTGAAAGVSGADSGGR